MRRSPNLPLLGRGHGLGLRDEVIVRDDAGAGREGGDGGAQDADDVGVGPVVEDVAEEVDGGGADGLRGEEVVGHEGDAGGDGGGDGVARAADHVGEVLDDEAEVGVGLGEGEGDVAAGAADVDDGGGAVGAGEGGPGVALGQEAGGEADAVGEGGHGAGEASGHGRVLGVVLPDRPVGALGQAPAGVVGFVALEPLPRLDGARERLPDLVEHVPEPGPGVGVVGQLARRGRVRDVALAGLVEDAVVGDGEADDASEVRFRHAAFPAQVCEGDLPVDGDVGGDVVFVDCLQAYTVQLRSGACQRKPYGLSCLDTYHGTKAHGGPEEKLVELETGVQGCLAGFLDFLIFNLEIDGAVYMERWRR